MMFGLCQALTCLGCSCAVRCATGCATVLNAESRSRAPRVMAAESFAAARVLLQKQDVW